MNVFSRKRRTQVVTKIKLYSHKGCYPQCWYSQGGLVTTADQDS